MSRKNRGKQQTKQIVPAPGAVQTESPERIVVPTLQNMLMANGLTDALGFSGNIPGMGFPGGPGIGGGFATGFGGGWPGVPAISDSTSLMADLRWFLVSNFRQMLSQAYVEIGLIQTLVNVPVDDGLRGGINFKSKQLDEQQLIDLKLEMDREDDINIAGWGSKWTRLFGGGGILILVEDQDPMEPLDLDAINEGTKVSFRAVDMWELYWDKQNVEGYDAEIQTEDFEYYNYYSEPLHKSRVMRLKGIEAPSFIRPRLRGWGLSVVETLVRSLNQYLKATDLGYEVLDEFKIDVYKIKNLVNTLLSPNGTNTVQQRVQLANWQKNYQNAVVMDAEDDWDHKQLSFSGLAETMQGIRMQVAADMRMPIIKLFGQSVSTGGLGTSAVEEMENYNSMVESEVRNKLKWHILKMAEIRCKQKFGMIPDDLEGEFKPLRELTAEQQETVKEKKFNRLLQAKSAGELTTLEFRDAANKGELFDVKLDTVEDGLNPEDPEIEAVASGEKSSEIAVGPDDDSAAEDDGGKNQDEDGANNPDSAKTKVRNDGEWDESKHPRADDGKFGKGGGGKGASDKDKKGAGEKSSAGKKAFSGFETKPPERQGMKSTSIEVLTKGGRGIAAKPSVIEYQSPKNSTCNMVGFVGFGKTNKIMQKKLNEMVQSAEVILSDMGIRFKTPLDFTCQNLSTDKNCTANYVRIREANPRVNIKAMNSGLQKSMMHEIGHAIDYALHVDDKAPSSRGHQRDAEKTELGKLHADIKAVVTASDYYTETAANNPKFKRYLNTDTEIFARGFECYAYAKGLELVERGELPPSFVQDYQPDVFKTKDQKVEELRRACEILKGQYNEAAKSNDEAKRTELSAQYAEAHKTYREMYEQNYGWESVAPDRQKEYMSKLTKAFDELFKKDTVKNAIERAFGPLAVRGEILQFNALDHLRRFFNSPEFDRASYEADGGDSWIADGRKELFENPGGVDEGLWAKAKAASQAAFGEVNWKFVTWWYKKQGGKFT